MTSDEITAKLSEVFSYVWIDDNSSFLDNGVTVWRCTENHAHPWGKVISLALVEGKRIPKDWFEHNMDMGLDAYNHPKNLSCVDYGWFCGYGKIGSSVITA